MYDVIIIGGGATGSGIALDASLRGLKVLLVEAHDFAEGTSSRSTKLAHGGVRYLEAAVKHLDKSQYALVKEGLLERFKILKNAPHLRGKLSLITPLYQYFEIPYIYSGLILYDLLSGRYSIGKSKFLPPQKTIKEAPSVKKANLKGSVKYYDGRFNDARMVIALLKSAQRLGAKLKNHTEFKEFIFENGKITGIKAYDKIKKETLTFKAKCVINATGPFSDFIRKKADPNIEEIMRPSRGIHIVIDKKYLPTNNGLLIPKTDDGRVVFILPYKDKCLVGTTDVEAKTEIHPKVTDKEIEYLLKQVNRYFDTDLKKVDILSSFAGIRPLVNKNPNAPTAKLTREHIIEKLPCNLVTITGGKWTTYRRMAEETVDFIVENFDFQKPLKKCLTNNYRLFGSENYEKTKELIDFSNPLEKHLFSLYGDQSIEIINSIQKPDFISEKYFITKKELLYTLKNEWVKKPLDFIVRRTQIALIDRKEAKNMLQKTTEIIGEFFGWDENEIYEEYTEALEILNGDI